MPGERHGLPEEFFAREDESADEGFYALPRFVTHIDDATIGELTSFYSETLGQDDRVLDLMSSWISHLPADREYREVVGHGMNANELERNPRLDKHVVQNLNEEPNLPWPDNHFNAVLIAVSVQYLTRPFEVFTEIGRILVPGGRCIVAMPHRLFPTKAVYAFHVLPPADRCKLVGSYMAQAGFFEDIDMVDRSPADADPLWIVMGTKAG